MRYGSVCSGVEAATVAWHPLGWTPQWFSEIEAFPCRVLRHHYPDVANLGDMTKLDTQQLYHESTIDLLVGGTPCQSFSLAGLREGLASSNGNLALEFCRILRKKRPRWFVWENVPGALSSFSDEAGGDLVNRWQSADFAVILTAFSDCGYSVAWRVLDSQFFGVPQQRRRLFVVGHLGDDWRPPAAVLFEPHCLRGDPAPGKEAGQATSGTLTASAGRSGGAGTPVGNLVANTVTTSNRRLSGDDNYVVMSSGQQNASVMADVSPTLAAHHNEVPIVTKWPADKANTLNAAFGEKQGLEDQHINSGAPLFVPLETRIFTQNQRNEVRFVGDDGQTTGALSAGGGMKQQPYLLEGIKIRRLTPREFERLQGFPDDYTLIPKASDSARYKAMGNSMPVPVMRWIGRRIDLVDQLIYPQFYPPPLR